MPARKTLLCATFPDDVSSEFADAVEKNTYVAAKADHSISFCNPMCGRLLIRRKKSRSHAVLPASPYQIIHCGNEPGMIELPWNSHRNGQIVVTDPRYVDSRNGDDRVEVLESANGFKLNNDSGFLVR